MQADDAKWAALIIICILGETSIFLELVGAVSGNQQSSTSTESTFRRFIDDYNPNFTKNENSFGFGESFVAKETTKGKVLPATNISDKRLPNRTICGPLTEEERIFGGENAAIDEFPWLVRIKYALNNGKEVYACAGSLITDHYVLTAAHCAVNLTIKEVRLGEWNVETDYDCQDSVCSGNAVDIKVSKVTPFPGYSKTDTFKGDIALLKLQRPVNFTDFIKPICLPATKHISNQDYSPESVYWAAGWGETEFAKKSPIKKKLQLESVPIAACRVKQPILSNINEPFVICAGGSEGKDTCVGDSGGALAKLAHDADSANWFLMGVTSYGYKECGTEGRPGLYARITPFMDWILENID